MYTKCLADCNIARSHVVDVRGISCGRTWFMAECIVGVVCELRCMASSVGVLQHKVGANSEPHGRMSSKICGGKLSIVNARDKRKQNGNRSVVARPNTMQW